MYTKANDAHMSFLMVGHTHNHIDKMFTTLTKKQIMHDVKGKCLSSLNKRRFDHIFLIPMNINSFAK